MLRRIAKKIKHTFIINNRKKHLNYKETVYVYSHTVSLLYCIFVPLFSLVLMEWVARGTLRGNKTNDGFFQSIINKPQIFILAYFALLLFYLLVLNISRRHVAAVVLTGIVSIVPATISYYKIQFRGEPFYPWDIYQVKTFFTISSAMDFTITVALKLAIAVFFAFVLLALFIKMPKMERKRAHFIHKMVLSALCVTGIVILLNGFYYNDLFVLQAGINYDQWDQQANYRSNGVLSAYLLNQRQLVVQKPKDYQNIVVADLFNEVEQAPAAHISFEPEILTPLNLQSDQPDIIYLMAESFWDPSELPGVSFSEEVTPNLNLLKQESAYGTILSPRFGGGTCDVEFEVLTGFSNSFLPADSKPYQQYCNKDVYALPWFLKGKGYNTLAVHGHVAATWNRNIAYPHLGFDAFISEENFGPAERRRSFISDESMVDKIIDSLEGARDGNSPLFIHAVTMENHAGYDRSNFPEEDLIRATNVPASMDDTAIGGLEDYATGIHDMDKALGKLTDYLRTASKPTILVFWGDHLVNMTAPYSIFEENGFIDGLDNFMRLYQPPLLVWSNFETEKVNLGIISAYNVTPLIMDMYGLEKPAYFDFLSQQMGVMRGYSQGYVVELDNTFSGEITPEQQRYLDRQYMLQYDYMFGKRYFEEYSADTQNAG